MINRFVIIYPNEKITGKKKTPNSFNKVCTFIKRRVNY